MNGNGKLGKRACIFAALVATLLASGAGADPDVTIDWVTVGDAGNAPDDTTYGAVDHSYRISKYEITNAQYREFLTNKAAVGDQYGLYSTGMAGTFGGISRSGSGTVADPYVYSAKGADTNWDSRPVNYVSFWDAARFANWMNNGQGSGDTESGAYINVGNQATFARQHGALFFLPTEDEWYKAAYYKGGGLNAGYWEYPTKSDKAPRAEAPPGTDMVNGSANYHSVVGPPYYTTAVGAYTAMPSSGPYGTFDQGGNVWEWNETVIAVIAPDDRGIRGGSWGSLAVSLSALEQGRDDSSGEFNFLGFRLASPIPGPATVSFFGCIAVAAMLRRRMRRA